MKKAVKPSKSKPDKKAAINKKNVAAKGVKKPAKPAPPSGGKATADLKKKAAKPVKTVKPAKTKKTEKTTKQVKPAKPVKATKPAAKKAAKPIKPQVKTKAKPAVAAKDKKSNKKPDTKAKALKEEKVKKTAKQEPATKVTKQEKPTKASKDSIVPKPAKSPKKSKGGRKPKKKDGDDSDEPIIEDDILIEQLISSTKKLKKNIKEPKHIVTFVNPMASLTLHGSVKNTTKAATKKEPKGKFEIEYVVHTSIPILYEFLTTPSGLAEWFADDVNIHDGIFTFFWDGSEQKAKLVDFKVDHFIRLQWLDKPEGSYFEWRIEKDDLTGDTSLMVVDFADEEADRETSQRLWDSQVHKLLNVIGSY